MLYSHPGKPLREHLLGSAKICRDIIRGIKLGEEAPFNAKLEDVAYLLGLCHDFGKGTKYFQDRLMGHNVAARYSQHGMLSALFTFHVFRTFFPTEILLAVMGFTIVRRHHGGLQGIMHDFSKSDIIEKNLEDLPKQLENLHIKELAGIYRDGFSELGTIEVNKVEVVEGFTLDRVREFINGEYNRLRIEVMRGRDYKTYIYYMLLYSTLLKADRFDIVGGMAERVEVPINAVDAYMEDKFRNVEREIDIHRRQAHEEVLQQVNAIDLSKDRILSINLPTGLGKTLTAFDFALKLRERLKREEGFEPRIIYTMPFLSIADQNYEVLRECLVVGLDKEPTSAHIVKHHHLADIVEGGDEEESIDKKRLLVEGWDAEVVVTTFVQLFHALFYTSSGMALKFPNIANAIVILDEVQAVPHRYWLAVREMLENVAKVLNSYFIFLTATMPMIFDRGRIRELVPNRERYFNILSRTKIIPNIEREMELEEFKEFCADVASKAEGKVLIVANTIREAREIYKELKDKVIKEIVYLSTHVIPKHRLERIKYVRENQKPVVIVSTQLVEAGVDIDVDVAIRDLGPLDSINQVAGRCNRNNRLEGAGKVYVCKVVDIDERGNRRGFHRYIYDPVLVDKTEELLEEQEVIEESRFLELVERYYERVRESISDQDSIETAEYIKRMDFKKIKEKFSIIEEKEMPKIDLFIEWDEGAAKVWEEYQGIQEIEDRIERKRKFERIKSHFYNYVISVPPSRKDLPSNRDEIVQFVGRDELENFYDPETGFIPEEGSAGIIV